MSHGLALVGAIGALPFLMASAPRRSLISVFGLAVFAVTMVLMYLTSTLYHALPVGRGKRILLKLDYGAIYLFIAGSYTPFAVGGIRDVWDGTVLRLASSMVVLGMTLKAFECLTHSRLSAGLYLVMGELVLIAAVPRVKDLPWPSLVWLVAGGLAYTTTKR